jgi:hypothetical protein
VGDGIKTQPRVTARPVIVTLLGAALVAPVTFLAAKPALIPAWCFDRFIGAPVLSWILLALMAGLVAVVMFAASPTVSGD